MTLDLPDEEIVALLAEFDRVIRDDRYFLSPCIQTLTAIRDKLRPPSVREPLPPPKRYEPPRATAARRRHRG